MSDSATTTTSNSGGFKLGGGGRLYQDARDKDALARARAMADAPPWADMPDDDDRRPPPDPKPEHKPSTVSVKLPPAPPKKRFDWREFCSTICELLGMTLVSVGVAKYLNPWLGVIIAGICLLVIGVASSRRLSG